jgi:pimeloyl-ACP methyl ester carboxylesterase
MTHPNSAYVAAAGFEVHVTHWGDPRNPALVMWHGLARTGRDFDEAAAALCDTYFVICPDTLGRGLSSWARDPKTDYSYRTFGDTALALLEHFGIEKLRWIGTSMGGVIGITLAGGRLKGRISHLVVNDIGPDVPQTGAGRIAAYVGQPPVYDTVAELEAWLRKNYAPFGKNSDAFWRRMADTSARRTDEGRVTVHYDPAIVTQITHRRDDLHQWPASDAVTAKTLLLRGESSDVLPADMAEEMTQRGPNARLEIMRDCGHAPTLTTWHEIALLREFLAE